MATQTQAKDHIARLREADEKLVSESLWQRAARRLRNDTLTMIALGVLLSFVIIAILSPTINSVILNVDPMLTSPREGFLPVGSEGHILGTDNLGRDHLSRLLYAGRISLQIGFYSATATLIIGLTLGMIAGYFGGIMDDFLNWVITTLDALPALYLLIAVSALLRPSAESLIFVIAITGWTGTTRLIRGQTLAIRDLDYVMAARALGAKPIRIMWSHIFPNLISLLAISLALGIGGVILSEAALSFLSLGVQPPTPTWGNMLTDSQSYFRQAGHLVIMPGLLISITVLCTYIIGDGVRDAFDPTTVD